MTETGSQTEESTGGGESAGGRHGRGSGIGEMVDRHRRAVAAAGGVVVLAVFALAAAVYLAERPGAGPVAASAKSRPPSASASAPGCAPGASAVPSGRPVALDGKRIGGATLKTADLPGGWKSRPSSGGGTGSAFRSGYAPLDNLVAFVASTPHRGVRFVQGDSGPLLEEFVSVSTAARAGEAVRTFAATGGRCATFSQPAVNGKHAQVSVSPLAVRVPGDEASAITLTVPTKSGPTAIDVVTTRLGNTLVVTYFAHLAKAGSDLLPKLLGKAVQRVEKSAGQ